MSNLRVKPLCGLTPSKHIFDRHFAPKVDFVPTKQPLFNLKEDLIAMAIASSTFAAIMALGTAVIIWTI